LSQSGKVLLVSYSVPPGGDRIVCKVVFKLVTPGDTGVNTWKLTNTANEGGDLSIGADLFSIPGNRGILSTDIDIELKNIGAYSLGSSARHAIHCKAWWQFLTLIIPLSIPHKF
jgi:hypothetical protein